ncbi:hypothetical protein [Pelagicoccus sp. SDUM812002]|uniref:hypothetical protein n=1 Tax=Pelagicoccus sp. SDUM812002 TaxID=3041266 RepID=UPI00281062EE|nr:hypothetical protein [Pelagicoccus sp. SDUM812002]MDQ8188601.1 hypothetical protein [Pelagicoccus sp. SDUM812002]
MPYDITGWIEVLWDHTLEEEKKVWSGVICLDRLSLADEYETSVLFGLAKRPVNNPLFAERGVPSDCSEAVDREVKENEAFIKKHGEGNFGFTHALWSEISPRLKEIEREEQISDDWNQVFDLAKVLEKTKFHPDWIRFVLWANW